MSLCFNMIVNDRDDHFSWCLAISSPTASSLSRLGFVNKTVLVGWSLSWSSWSSWPSWPSWWSWWSWSPWSPWRRRCWPGPGTAAGDWGGEEQSQLPALVGNQPSARQNPLVWFLVFLSLSLSFYPFVFLF